MICTHAYKCCCVSLVLRDYGIALNDKIQELLTLLCGIAVPTENTRAA
jgi:hypothetical protein